MEQSAGGRSTALYCGLVACGLALTGLVMGTHDRPEGRSAEGGSFAHVVRERPPLEECQQETGARVGDPGAGPRGDGEVSPEQAAEYERRLREALEPMRGQEVAPPSTVPVAVHVIAAENGEGDVGRESVEQQLEVLNDAYAGRYAADSEGVDTGFRFELSDLTQHRDDEWFHDFDLHRDTIRADLRRGGPETLNIYITDLGDGLLGYSTFPQDSESSLEQDGIVLAHDTLPGGDREGFDRGHTGTHEVGHWLGLFHTFQNGCQEPGDYVDDTPYEREAASGCPVGRDTCPERSGKDPVTNFMNYSDDACMTHFTQGQAERMVEHWVSFRAPKT